LSEWEKALESLNNVDLSDANLAVSSVDINVDIISAFEHPLMGHYQIPSNLRV